jgi:hypothetical protein
MHWLWRCLLSDLCPNPLYILCTNYPARMISSAGVQGIDENTSSSYGYLDNWVRLKYFFKKGIFSIQISLYGLKYDLLNSIQISLYG